MKDLSISEIKAGILVYCSDSRPRADVIAKAMALNGKLDRSMASSLVYGMAGKEWLDLDPQGNEFRTTAKGSKALRELEAEE